MNIESKRFVGGHEIKPGARIPHPTNLQRGALQLLTVCDQVNPDRWHAEIMVLGKTVLATEQFGTREGSPEICDLSNGHRPLRRHPERRSTLILVGAPPSR